MPPNLTVPFLSRYFPSTAQELIKHLFTSEQAGLTTLGTLQVPSLPTKNFPEGWITITHALEIPLKFYPASNPLPSFFHHLPVLIPVKLIHLFFIMFLHPEDLLFLSLKYFEMSLSKDVFDLAYGNFGKFFPLQLQDFSTIQRKCFQWSFH